MFQTCLILSMTIYSCPDLAISQIHRPKVITVGKSEKHEKMTIYRNKCKKCRNQLISFKCLLIKKIMEKFCLDFIPPAPAHVLDML